MVVNTHQQFKNQYSGKKRRGLPISGNFISLTSLSVLLIAAWLQAQPIITARVNQKASSSGKKVPSLSATQLFATTKSPGSIAVGVAEGNLTVAGKSTASYYGHTDPGNHVINKGFCSWNKAHHITVAEADRRCMTTLQHQSFAIERSLKTLGIDPKLHTEALVNGTDLWNQSRRAGADFTHKYQKALGKKLTSNRAILYARVEAFRNEKGQLDASGLFGICLKVPYYRDQLKGKKPYSEPWQWECIALDQERRIEAINRALKNVR